MNVYVLEVAYLVEGVYSTEWAAKIIGLLHHLRDEYYPGHKVIKMELDK